jgi:sigma-B regulation protein RsbU (phosphoserine phosphatase)
MATPNFCGGSLASEEPQEVTHVHPPASRAGSHRPSRSLPAGPDYHLVTNGHRVERRRLEEELALAARIQARLFPAVLPQLAGCELAARNRPALLCGGDYYDVLPTAEPGERGPHLLCVADVSGKGLPASLLMSNLQATLRASLGYRPALVDLVVRTNELLHASTPTDRYITAILANFEPVTGRCTFVNAGHNGGILIRVDGRVDCLKATGPPLGLLRDLPFLSERIELLPGDVLCLYSDGVPEAFNPQDEEWGDERLMICLHQCRHLDPERIVSKVFEEIDAFAGHAPQHDDITMLVLKRKG